MKHFTSIFTVLLILSLHLITMLNHSKEKQNGSQKWVLIGWHLDQKVGSPSFIYIAKSATCLKFKESSIWKMGFYSLKMSLICKDYLFFPFFWVYPYVFFLLEFFWSFFSFFLLIWVHPHVFFLLEGRTSSSSSMLTLVSSVDPVI